jgi:DNA repair protein RecO (recombination protein O)
MSYIKTRGLVVREIAVGDYDKILTLVTDKLGKVSVSAKGVRRSGNRHSAGTQILSYCDWVLYKGRSTYILNSCEIVHSFYKLRENLTLLAYAAHMLDMVQDTAYENQPAEKPLKLLLHALNALSTKNMNPELVVRVFSLKLLQIMGFTPLLSGCCLCGTKKIDEIYFSYGHCGLLCEKCHSNAGNALRLEPGTAKALIYVICAEIGRVFDFELSESVLRNFSEVVDKFTDEKLEKKYNKLSFLNEIK